MINIRYNEVYTAKFTYDNRLSSEGKAYINNKLEEFKNRTDIDFISEQFVREDENLYNIFILYSKKK